MTKTSKAYDPVVNRTGGGYHGSPRGARGYTRSRGVEQEESILQVVSREDGYTLTITQWDEGEVTVTITPKLSGRWMCEEVDESTVPHIIERFLDGSLFITS